MGKKKNRHMKKITSTVCTIGILSASVTHGYAAEINNKQQQYDRLQVAETDKGSKDNLKIDLNTTFPDSALRNAVKTKMGTTSDEVTLEQLSNVRDVLDLSGKGVKNFEGLQYLTGLNALYIKNSNLTEVPQQVLELKELKILDLSRNTITTIPDNMSFDKLRVLDLSYNKITAVPDSVWELPKLQALLLSNNKIKSIPEKKSKFLDLRIFDLANNELETLSVGLLHDLARLEVLNIQGGNNKKLELADVKLLKGLVGLKVLELNSDVSPEEINKQLKVGVLKVKGNQVGLISVNGVTVLTLSKNDPVFKLDGEQNMYKEAGKPATIPTGTITATKGLLESITTKNILGLDLLSKEVNGPLVEGKNGTIHYNGLNTRNPAPGSYTVNYNILVKKTILDKIPLVGGLLSFLFDKGNIEKLVDTRNVIVVDVTSPTIGTDEIEVDDPSTLTDEKLKELLKVKDDVSKNVAIQYDKDLKNLASAEEEVTFTVQDEYDNINVKTVKVKSAANNQAPAIEAKDSILAKVGDEVDVIKSAEAKAMDKEDGDLTSKIQVEGTVDTQKVSTQKVSLKVTDKHNETTSKDVEVRVIRIQDKVTVNQKDLDSNNFDPKKLVEGLNDEDKVTTKVNNGKIEVTVTNKNGHQVTGDMTPEINGKPSIEAKDKVFVEKDKKDFDVKKEAKVKVIDKEDGDLTDKAVVEGTLELDKTGEQKVKVTITDKDGETAEKEITVNVIRIQDEIEVNKKDIVDGKVKDEAINKEKVVDGLDKDSKEEVKVEITVDEENGKGKVTVKDKEDNVVSEKEIKVKVTNEKPEIKVEKDELFVEKDKKDFDVKKEAKVTVIDKEDGDLTDQAEVKDFDIKTVGEQKAKVTVTDKAGETVEAEITVNVIEIRDEIEVNKKDIDKGKVKDEAIDKEKVVDGLNKDSKEKVKVEITVDEENGKGKVTVKDKDGNTVSEKEVKVKTVTELVKINVAPMIEAKGKVLAFVGDQVDAKYVIEKSGAKATDKEDGDLTAKIEVEGKVDTSKAGESKVTLKVTDSQGATGNKEVTVKVVKINDTIEVKEKDIVDGKVTNDKIDKEKIGEGLGEKEKVEIIIDKDGKGKVVVTDEEGNKVEKEVTVKVKDDNKVINEKPVIKVEKEEVFVEKDKKNFDLKKEAKVTITDKEDGDLTDQAEVKDFDIKTVGEQKAKVTVTDKAGETVEAKVTVNVIEIQDEIEVNKEDIVEGKVKEDKIDKEKVVGGLNKESKEKVKVEITVDEENEKGKVTVKDKDGNVISEKEVTVTVKDDQGG
uniref:immunoglobulin-like domain-containing protein n=2 Tax=Bacillus cereus group TaxID=86661 RepID=UPI00397CC712